MTGFLRRVLSPYRGLLILVILLQLGQSFLTMYLPTINSRVIDYGVANADAAYIMHQGILMLGIALIQLLLSTLAGIFGAKVALMTGRDLREQVYEKLIHFSRRMIGSMGAPTLITRATNDVQQVIQFITFLFTAIIAAPMMFIGGLVLALSQSVKLSVVLLVTIPLLLGVSVVFLKLILPYYREQQTKIDEMNTVLRDQISGIRVVKAFTKEQGEKERFERINGDLSRINTSIGKITGLMQPIFTLTMSFANISLIWLGGRMAGNGQVQIGQVIGFVTYISFILTATLMASMIFIMLPRAEVSVTRIEEILNSESEIQDREDAFLPEQFRGEICFEHVTYSYAPDNEQPSLSHTDNFKFVVRRATWRKITAAATARIHMVTSTTFRIRSLPNVLPFHCTCIYHLPFKHIFSSQLHNLMTCRFKQAIHNSKAAATCIKAL